MNIYKHFNHNLEKTVYLLNKVFCWGDITTEGVLCGFEDITDLSTVYNLYLREEISYIQYKRYLDNWYNYHKANNNTDIINANKDFLLRANTLERQDIYEEYGEMAFQILDEYHERSKNCRTKMYNYAISVIRTFIDLSQQVQILYIINQHKLRENYIEYGIEGKNYGDAVAGIMDFVEGTNDFAGKGLADMNLITKFEKTKEEIIQKIKKYLFYGDITNEDFAK
jgi:hypothetical protein